MSKTVKPKHRYRIAINEDGYIIEVGLCSSMGAARKVAMHHVDDAMPNNTVHVYDDWMDGVSMGFAYLDHEGESAYRDVAKKS